MSMSTMSLLGMQKYLNSKNEDLFSKLHLPDGIDRDILINTILLRSNELEVLYASPEYFRDAIEVWSQKHARTFTKWLEAISLEYDPLENYDRKEDWSDNSNSNGVSNATASGAAEDKRSSYDSRSYENNNMQSSNSNNNASFNNNTGSTHTGRVHGNIGVTTSMQLVTAQLELVQWNLYEHIADLFIEEFCLLVY